MGQAWPSGQLLLVHLLLPVKSFLARHKMLQFAAWLGIVIGSDSIRQEPGLLFYHCSADTCAAGV